MEQGTAGSNVWASGDVLTPTPADFPCCFDTIANLKSPTVSVPVEALDLTRPQDGTTDPTILYGSVSGYGKPSPYPSYNAELFKQLSPSMIEALQAKFPPSV